MTRVARSAYGMYDGGGSSSFGARQQRERQGRQRVAAEVASARVTGGPRAPRLVSSEVLTWVPAKLYRNSLCRVRMHFFDTGDCVVFLYTLVSRDCTMVPVLW